MKLSSCLPGYLLGQPLPVAPALLSICQQSRVRFDWLSLEVAVCVCVCVCCTVTLMFLNVRDFWSWWRALDEPVTQMYIIPTWHAQARASDLMLIQVAGNGNKCLCM